MKAVAFHVYTYWARPKVRIQPLSFHIQKEKCYDIICLASWVGSGVELCVVTEKIILSGFNLQPNTVVNYIFDRYLASSCMSCFLKVENYVQATSTEI
jgi:hypothetical protein